MTTEPIDAEIVPKNQLARTTHLPATLQDVEAVVQRMQTIHELMKRAMTVNIDYGVVPGTNSKPTLLKSGAEKICVMFNLCPRYKTMKTWDGPHLTVETTCVIHSLNGTALGEASAMCSTRESKYAWRKSERVCPQCGKGAIIKGKAEYGGGFICFAKKGGCGAKFRDDDKRITDQQTGRMPNEDLPDSYNTVLRIAEKRAYIAAVRLVTGSSALFDEEIPDAAPERDQMPQEATQEPKATAEPLKPVQPPTGKKWADMTLAEKLWGWHHAIAKCANVEELNKFEESFRPCTVLDKATYDATYALMDQKAATFKDHGEGEHSHPFADTPTKTQSETNGTFPSEDEPKAPPDQASRIAWYKQQIPLAKQGKCGTGTPQEQVLNILRRARDKEFFTASVVADIGRMAYIALGDLATDGDELFDIWECAKTWLAGPDLGAVEKHYSMRRLAIKAAEMVDA